MQKQRKMTNQFIQSPLFLSNAKNNQNIVSAPKPYLTRTNSKSNSIKKISEDLSTKQLNLQTLSKYIIPDKIQASSQKSILHSQNNLASLFIQGQFQDISATITQSNQVKLQPKYKKQEIQYRTREKVNLTKPFDALSGMSGQISKLKNDEYYLYWKGKANQYLQSNIKLMEQIRKITRQNQELKQRIYSLQLNAQPIIRKEIKNSSLVKESLRGEQKRSNACLVEKMEQLQRELKKKEIVVKSYQQKIIQLNQKIVGDTERSKLINKLKIQIDNLKAQLDGSKTSYLPSQENSIQLRLRSTSGGGNLKGSNFGRR